MLLSVYYFCVRGIVKMLLSVYYYIIAVIKTGSVN